MRDFFRWGVSTLANFFADTQPQHERRIQSQQLFFNAPFYRWGRTSWCSGIRKNSMRFDVQRNSGESHYLQIAALKRGIDKKGSIGKDGQSWRSELIAFRDLFESWCARSPGGKLFRPIPVQANRCVYQARNRCSNCTPGPVKKLSG